MVRKARKGNSMETGTVLLVAVGGVILVGIALGLSLGAVWAMALLLRIIDRLQEGR